MIVMEFDEPNGVHTKVIAAKDGYTIGAIVELPEGGSFFVQFKNVDPTHCVNMGINSREMSAYGIDRMFS